MLRIVIAEEGFDNEKQEFVDINPVVVDLEHSLLSVSKWESFYQKPFLSGMEKSKKEMFGYLQAMMITPGLDPDVLYRCSAENIATIEDYINSTQSATTFGSMPERRGPGEVITSELIYFWMVSFNIPFECETWHLNRLFSLIRICNIKSQKPKQMSSRQIAMRNRELNNKRKAEMGTSG